MPRAARRVVAFCALASNSAASYKMQWIANVWMSHLAAAHESEVLLHVADMSHLETALPHTNRGGCINFLPALQEGPQICQE